MLTENQDPTCSNDMTLYNGGRLEARQAGGGVQMGPHCKVVEGPGNPESSPAHLKNEGDGYQDGLIDGHSVAST